MNRHVILIGFLLTCFMLMMSTHAYSDHCGETTTATTGTTQTTSSKQATVPSTQSTANIDLHTPGSENPLSSPPLVSQTNAMTDMEKEARDAQAKVMMDTFDMGLKIAEALAQHFETPHSDNLEHWGHSQVTDTIYVDNPPPETPRGTTPPEQKSPHSPPEYLGDGLYGNVADTANNTPAPINDTAESKGDIIKMQATSQTEAPPLPKDINKFAEYMDSMSTRDYTKPPPQKYQQGPAQVGGPIQADHNLPSSGSTTQQNGQTSTGGNSNKAGGAQGNRVEPDFIVH